MTPLAQHLEARVLIFIDGPNLNGMQEAMQLAFDFGKFLKFLLRWRKPIEEGIAARYYMKGRMKPEQQGFVNFLKNLGFKIFFSGDEEVDIDDLLERDLKEHWPEPDVIVLVSGDRDFSEPLKIAKEAGKKIEVVGIEEMTSRTLKDLADEFIDLNKHRQEIMDFSRTLQRDIRRYQKPRKF